MTLTFNINDTVVVRLTEHGKAVWQAYWKQASDWAGIDLTEHATAKIDSDGWLKEQLWKLMQIFGPKMYVGGERVFQKNLMAFDERTLRARDKREEAVAETFWVVEIASANHLGYRAYRTKAEAVARIAQADTTLWSGKVEAATPEEAVAAFIKLKANAIAGANDEEIDAEIHG